MGNVNINNQEDPYKIIDDIFSSKGWRRESKHQYYQGGKVLANSWVHPKFKDLYISIIHRPENLGEYELRMTGKMIGKFNSDKEAALAAIKEMHQIQTGRRLPPRVFTEKKVQHLNEFERKAKEKYRKDEFNPYNPSNVQKPPKINPQAAKEIEQGANWSLSQKLDFYKQNLKQAFGMDNTNKTEANPNLIITKRGNVMDNNDLSNLLLNAKILLKAMEDEKNHELIKSALEKVCPVPPQKLFREKFLNRNKINKDEKNPDKEADARLGEEVEDAVERHFKENKEAEQKEGHKLMAKNEDLVKMISFGNFIFHPQLFDKNPQLAEEAVNKGDAEVRKKIASHPQLFTHAPHLAEKLANDKDPSVREALKKHPDLHNHPYIVEKLGVTATNKNEKDVFEQFVKIADSLLKSQHKQKIEKCGQKCDKKIEKKDKSGRTKHDRCVEHVKENSPDVDNPHAVCVSRGVYPEKWSKAEIKEALKEDYKPKFYKPKK